MCPLIWGLPFARAFIIFKIFIVLNTNSTKSLLTQFFIEEMKKSTKKISFKKYFPFLIQFFLRLCEISSILLGILSRTLSKSSSFNSPLTKISLTGIYLSLTNVIKSFNTNSDISSPSIAKTLNRLDILAMFWCVCLSITLMVLGFWSKSDLRYADK